MRYKLHSPPLAHLEAGARWLRTLDRLGSHEVAGLDARAYLSRLALPAAWRTRDKLTQPELPPATDLQTWSALGASDALAARQPRVNSTDQRPCALAYAAAYVAVFGAYMQEESQQDETPAVESGVLGDLATITWSAQFGKIAAAYAKAQATMDKLAKSHEAEVKTRDPNKRDYKYNYANLPDALDACLAAFNAQGCAIIQAVTSERQGVNVTTLILHESNQWIRTGVLFMPVSGNAQAVGSAVTYGKRYQLLGVVGLAPDDDDDGKAADDNPPDRQQLGAKKSDAIGARCSGKSWAGDLGREIDQLVQDLATLAGTQPGDVWWPLIEDAGVSQQPYMDTDGDWPGRPSVLSMADGKLVKAAALKKIEDARRT